MKIKEALTTLSNITEIESLFATYEALCNKVPYRLQPKLTESYYKKIVELLSLQPIVFNDIKQLTFGKRWTGFNNSQQSLDYLNLAHSFKDGNAVWIEYTNGYIMNRVLTTEFPEGCAYIVLGNKLYQYRTHIKHHTLVYNAHNFTCQGKLNEYSREFQVVDGAIYNLDGKRFSAMWVDNVSWFVHTSQKYVPVILSENEQWHTGNHRVLMPLGNR